MHGLALIVVVIICMACERSSPRDDSSAPGASAARHSIDGCYRSPSSVMGRTTPLTGRPSVAPGWLRFDGTGPDSGGVGLTDADGAAIEGRWHRATGDSIEIRARNDFMDVTLRVATADTILAGSGLLTSDVDLRRNAAGALEPLRREWRLAATTASCDSMPTARR
jgi:hypothetical protein